MCSFHSVDAVQLMNGNQSVYELQSLHHEKKAVCLRRKKNVKEKFVPIKRKAICIFGTTACTQAYTVPYTWLDTS